MANAKRWMAEFDKQAKAFGVSGSDTSAGMGAIGLSGLAAGAGIAGVVKSFRDLADRAVDLKETARLTGMTTDQIQLLDRAAKDFNVDPDQLNAGLKGWASKFEEFRRHMGNVYGELNQIDPAFARELFFEQPLDQVKDIFHWLSQIHDPQLQRKWAELYFGTGDVSRLLAEGWTSLNAALDHAAQTGAELHDKAA